MLRYSKSHPNSQLPRENVRTAVELEDIREVETSREVETI